MLFMDLTVNGTVVFTGQPCLSWVLPAKVQGFDGYLLFLDSQSVENPTFTGLGGRFTLLYYPEDFSTPYSVEVSATPAQTFNVTLGTQNCEISLYEKDVEA